MSLCRAALCLFLLLLGALPSTARETLLVLVDERMPGLGGDIWNQWLDQVGRRETNFAVVVVEIPRSETRQWVTNDWPRLALMADAVARYNPHTILIVGDLPFLITGGHNDDGHELRCITTDVWLAVSDFVFADAVDWGMTGYDPGGYPLNRNIAGDGRPDSTIGTKARRVGRLNFAGLTQPGDDSNWSSGCLAGLSKAPAINEGLAFRAYLTNNVGYRTGQWTTTSTGIMAGGLWSASNWSTATNANTAVTWTRNTGYLAGGTARFYYENWDSNEVQYFYDGSCVPTRVLVDLCYRSYCMEIYRNYNIPFRRLFPGREPNPHAVVYLWTNGGGTAMFWRSATANRLTGDMIDTSVAAFGGAWPFTRNFFGDPTCPIVPQTGPPGVLVAGAVEIAP